MRMNDWMRKCTVVLLACCALPIVNCSTPQGTPTTDICSPNYAPPAGGPAVPGGYSCSEFCANLGACRTCCANLGNPAGCVAQCNADWSSLTPPDRGTAIAQVTELLPASLIELIELHGLGGELANLFALLEAGEIAQIIAILQNYSEMDWMMFITGIQPFLDNPSRVLELNNRSGVFNLEDPQDRALIYYGWTVDWLSSYGYHSSR